MYPPAGVADGGHVSPLPGGASCGAVMCGPTSLASRAPAGSFLNLFGGDGQLSFQDIADKASQLQQRVEENAEHEKASLRAMAEEKHREIERQAADLNRHALSSIEAYKEQQLQTVERNKEYQKALVRQQTDQSKRIIDQQAAQAIAEVEARDRHVELQRQGQQLGQQMTAEQGRIPVVAGPCVYPGAAVPAGRAPYPISMSGIGCYQPGGFSPPAQSGSYYVGMAPQLSSGGFVPCRSLHTAPPGAPLSREASAQPG